MNLKENLDLIILNELHIYNHGKIVIQKREILKLNKFNY